MKLWKSSDLQEQNPPWITDLFWFQSISLFFFKHLPSDQYFLYFSSFISVFVDSCEPATEGPETEQPDPLDEGDQSKVRFPS